MPAIEQAQYSNDYASDLQIKISRDYNYKTNQAEGKNEEIYNIIEMIFSDTEKMNGSFFSHKKRLYPT